MGEKSCRTIKKKDRLLLPFGYAGSAMVWSKRKGRSAAI
jgi:hypothetical protein